jgi:ubiquinone/menaquinone biosynthesis C-methylase UbiE
VDALHHVIHQQQTADELWRVLRPGGRIVIEDMDIRFAAVKLVALVEKMALMRSHFLSAEGIQSLFNHHPDAQRSVQFDGFTTWVIVDKLANAG